MLNRSGLGIILAILGAAIGLVAGLFVNAGWWIIGTTILGLLIGSECGIAVAFLLTRADRNREPSNASK